jgi:hypothetical protein
MHSYNLSHFAPVTEEFIAMYSNIWLAGSIDVHQQQTGNKPLVRRYNLVIKGTEWTEFKKYLKSLRTEEIYEYKDLTDNFFKTTNIKIINHSGVDNE